MVKIQIPRSKTDQSRKGDEVVIAMSWDGTCPVQMLEKYIKTGKIRMDSKLFLFCQITKLGKVEYLRDGGAMSYTTIRGNSRRKLKNLGILPMFLVNTASGHEVLQQQPMQGCQTVWHERCRSDNVKDGYIEDSMDKRLTVTHHLGILNCW